MPVSLPYALTNGTPADADQVMADFNALASAIEALVPVGAVSAYAGGSAPAGYLLCDGTAVSRTTYAALFNVLGVAYGVGNGSTTFNLPDLRGRVPVGVDGAAARLAASDTLGAASGAETHTLTTAQMPAHAHQPSDNASFFWVTGGSSPVGSLGFAAGAGTDKSLATSETVGSGSAHNNMPPYQVVNYIVKT